MSAAEARRHVPGPLPNDVLDAFHERCVRERRAAGLPEHVEDPEILDRIAAIAALPSTPDRRRRAGASTRTGPEVESPGPGTYDTSPAGSRKGDRRHEA